MKKFLAGICIALVALVALPAAGAGATASYCGPGAYNAAYRAVYEYPTGSYWQAQIAANPAYYAANNAFYLNKYGC